MISRWMMRWVELPSFNSGQICAGPPFVYTIELIMASSTWAWPCRAARCQAVCPLCTGPRQRQGRREGQAAALRSAAARGARRLLAPEPLKVVLLHMVRVLHVWICPGSRAGPPSGPHLGTHVGPGSHATASAAPIGGGQAGRRALETRARSRRVPTQFCAAYAAFKRRARTAFTVSSSPPVAAVSSAVCSLSG